jgi:hypothetical protein
MTLNEIMQDIIALEEDMLVYERKYGIPSEFFMNRLARVMNRPMTPGC